MSLSLTQSPAWRALEAHRRAIEAMSLRAAFANDPARFDRFSLGIDGLFVDYSKQLVTGETLRLLLELAHSRDLPGWIGRMFAGERINSTEKRAALHVALRARGPVLLDGVDVAAEAARTFARMRVFCEGARGGSLTGSGGHRYTDIVNIGIGGSDLGPALVADALAPYCTPRLRAHFVSNVDGTQIARVLANLEAGSTLFVIASKTFTTLETLANARTAREWLSARLPGGASPARHFAAVTANLAAAREFGVDAERVFGFGDWVGGRYSVWSAVGLAAAIAIGMDHFDALREGARVMDEHFAGAPLERNLPVLLGLIGVWNTDFLGARTHAVLPYDQSLQLLPAYLQQLEMESNGKRVTREGGDVDCATAPVVWGAPGTNGQHAFFQLLHQGTQLVPADFIGCCRSHNALGAHHEMLMSNFFAQTEALMRGKSREEALEEMLARGVAPAEAERLAPHRAFPGNRPTTSIVLPRLDPHRLGMLLALYEHKVYVQSVIWGINAFDQWGVELGKTLANRILPQLTTSAPATMHDASTNGLINHFKAHR
ncbi:MAG: glucose-6-phosphate isomerase [Burkholderiales bacterium]|nr:glucose-6-phosphate isomerase [Burkholderiales bacterium]